MGYMVYMIHPQVKWVQHAQSGRQPSAAWYLQFTISSLPASLHDVIIGRLLHEAHCQVHHTHINSWHLRNHTHFFTAMAVMTSFSHLACAQGGFS